MVDDTELTLDAESVAEHIREALARHASGEQTALPQNLDKALERDGLRAWLERQTRG